MEFDNHWCDVLHSLLTQNVVLEGIRKRICRLTSSQVSREDLEFDSPIFRVVFPSSSWSLLWPGPPPGATGGGFLGGQGPSNDR